MEQIYLVVTEKCNLNCQHCIRGKKDQVDMSIDFLQAIIEKIKKEYTDVEWVITGGEPTLHPEIKKILRYTSKMADDILVTSNGFTNYYNEYEKKDNIKYQISLDGYNEIHNNIRGINNYRTILSNIRRMIQDNVKVMVSTTVNSYNYKSLKLLYEDLISAGVKWWYVNNMLPFGCAKESSFQPIPILLWNDLVYTMHKNCKDIELRMSTQFDMREQTIKSILCGEKECKGCGSGTEKVYIYPNGNVYACTCMKDIVLGNIEENSLKEILNSKQSKKVIDTNVNQNSVCKECELLEVCKGGCKGMSIYKFGKIGYGDIRCPKVRNYYEESILS